MARLSAFRVQQEEAVRDLLTILFDVCFVLSLKFCYSIGMPQTGDELIGLSVSYLHLSRNLCYIISFAFAVSLEIGA